MSAKKRILMAVYNPIEVDGRVKRTAASLAESFELTLLCPPASRGRFDAPSYDIVRVPLRGSGRMTRLLSFWCAFIAVSRRTLPDAVYAHDFFLPLPGWLAAKLVGAKFVYDAHELIVPDSGERLSSRSWLFYRCEQLAVRRADLVIAANPERAAVMRKHYRLHATPVSVGNVPPAPAGALSDDEVLAQYPGLRRAHPDDIHVVYMGDMSFERGLGVLVECAGLLPERYKLIFVGAGPDLERLRELASGALAQRIRVLGPAPHAHVHDLIRMGDIGYVSYSMVGLNNILCAPNKVFEYAHAGLPMVATCQPTIRRLFEHDRIGRLVGCEGRVDAAQVAAAIEDVVRDLAQYRAALAGFLKGNTWQAEAARLLHSMRTLVASGSPELARE